MNKKEILKKYYPELENRLEHEELLFNIDKSIKEIEKNLDGKIKEVDGKIKTIDEEKIVESVLSKIPKPKDGEDYVLTDRDKAEIASKIDVPIVEKVIEKTKVVHDRPVVTNEVKEVAIVDAPEVTAEKLNTLKEAIDVSVIKGAVSKKEVDEKVLDGMAKIDGRVKLLDQRWHGGGLKTVAHDTTLTGDGTSSNPLSAAGIAENYKSKISSADTTANYLENKIIAGNGITLTKENAGANEDLKISGFANPMTNAGDIIYGGASGTPERLGIGGANTVLHGGTSAPSYSAVVEDDISLSNVTTNNATTVKHGFLPTLSGNPSQYLNGSGNFSTPSGTVNSYSLTSFTSQTSVNVIHNFGTYPNVQILDSTGAVIIPLSIINNTLNDFTVTFSVSISGSIIATVGAPQPQSVTTVSSSTYNVLNTDRIITVTAAGAIITLPTAVGNTGREFIIDNASSGNITITGSQTIEGETSQTIPPDSAINVYSTGSVYRWY